MVESRKKLLLLLSLSTLSMTHMCFGIQEKVSQNSAEESAGQPTIKGARTQGLQYDKILYIVLHEEWHSC
jgi:hypothetical protein